MTFSPAMQITRETSRLVTFPTVTGQCFRRLTARIDA